MAGRTSAVHVQSCPPQSHKSSLKPPRNFIWLFSTSMVAPSRRVSAASCDLKMMARIEVLPEPDLPIKRTCTLEIEYASLGKGEGSDPRATHLFARFGRHPCHLNVSSEARNSLPNRLSVVRASRGESLVVEMPR